MTELWIRFTDENGEEKRVEVDKERFTIGRHSSSDLAITNSKLSREHLRIERFGDVFVAVDSGSSNGTELNGELMTGPVALKSGDKADLGGGLEVEFELKSDEDNAAASSGEDKPNETEAASATRAAAPSIEPAGFSIGYLIAAPVLGLILLISVVGLIYVFSGAGKSVDNRNGSIYSTDRDDDDDTPQTTKTVTSATPSNTATNPAGDGSPSPTPANLSETAKVETAAAAFLRRIAQNDPTAFITSDQAKRVAAKVKQFGGSTALADNINSARRSASQIRALAAAKNLKPQLLATAALARLGTQRGDVLATANSMADVLDRLGTQVGNELSEDCLLMIAAYSQGQAGDFLKLRNMLQDLATKYPESTRAIRSIWFLEKQGKISAAEFDFALRFLAIGTITQNPRDFGVNAEALTL